MTRIALAALVAVLAWLLVMGPPARAEVLCEHRSAAHTAEHGGLAADSAWHLAHGDLPTCGEDEGSRPAPREDKRQGESNDRFCIGRCNDKWWRND